MSEVRKGVHLSIAANWMRAVFWVPSVAKKKSLLASVRPFPPDPDGPPAIEIVDDDAGVVPLPDGDIVHPDRPRPGRPARATCCCMQILTRALTVLLWRRSAWATVALVISRQSAPTCIAKRWVKRGFFASESRRSTYTPRRFGPCPRQRSNWT